VTDVAFRTETHNYVTSDSDVIYEAHMYNVQEGAGVIINRSSSTRMR